MEACEDVLGWRCLAARSTMSASSSEQGSLCEAGSKEGERGDVGGERGARVGAWVPRTGKAACKDFVTCGKERPGSLQECIRSEFSKWFCLRKSEGRFGDGRLTSSSNAALRTPTSTKRYG